jgi:hypothetical protein
MTTLSAWDDVLAAVRSAPYPVEVPPADPDRARSCLATATPPTVHYFASDDLAWVDLGVGYAA